MIFRYARHTKNLIPIEHFYGTVLGLSKIGNFEDHEGYNGVFFGKENENWHLEFTISKEIPKHYTNEDDGIVFYPASDIDYKKIIKGIQKYKIQKVEAKNPYWRENGITILDPDGFRVIISDLKIKQYVNI